MAQLSTSEAGRGESVQRRIAGPFVTLDLPHEIARLRAEPAYRSEDHAGRTLAKYPDLRVVLEAMKPGARLPIHETAERLTVQVMYGEVLVRLDHGERCELGEGAFAAFDAARVHEIECTQECAFLLTVAWPPAVERG